MKKIVFILITFVLFTSIALSQQKKGISKDDLQKIKQSYDVSQPAIRALTNALTNNSFDKVALNRWKVNQLDNSFKYKVDLSGITNQQKSGRCWMFTGLNVLRHKVEKEYNINNFEFSTNYLYFWDQFEKANIFLQAVIDHYEKPLDHRMMVWLFRSPVGDGGVWNSLTNLIEKYGVVPKDVMPETVHSENTRALRSLIKRKLREQGLELIQMADSGADFDQLVERKIQMLGDIYRILALALSQPPEEFVWRYENKDGEIIEEKHTPKSLAKKLIPVDFNDYLMLMDDPTRPYNQLYEIEYDRNVQEGKNWLYINLPAEKIKQYAKKSIIENEAMYFSCDVGKQLNRDAGRIVLENYDFESLLGIGFEMDKKQRILTRESGSTHGMALVGVDVDSNDNITKWLLENSWGASSGEKGYLIMGDDWFDEYMFRVVVLKKFIDKEILKILDKKPTMLPPWDPMYKMDE
jgi:bleomycin hydrolase